MLSPRVDPIGHMPSAHAPSASGTCPKHGRHHCGTCPSCQRAAKARLALQNAQATAARQAWLAQQASPRVAGNCAHCGGTLYAGQPMVLAPMAHVACSVMACRRWAARMAGLPPNRLGT